MIKKPKLEVQLELLAEHGRRLADPKSTTKALFVFGPTGVGKSYVVKRTIGPYHPAGDATRVGILDIFRNHANACILGDDWDGIWTDISMLNVFKAALSERNAHISHVNRQSIRDGTSEIVFSGRFVLTSNHDMGRLPAKYVPHVEALAARATVIHLTRVPSDLLDFLDWRVCECDHFRSEQFYKDTGITSLGLQPAQDVLDFIHEFAWRLPSVSLRVLNSVAIERKRYPDGWHDRALALLRDKAVIDRPAPPAPTILRWRERHPPKTDTAAALSSELEPAPYPSPISVPELKSSNLAQHRNPVIRRDASVRPHSATAEPCAAHSDRNGFGSDVASASSSEQVKTAVPMPPEELQQPFAQVSATPGDLTEVRLATRAITSQPLGAITAEEAKQRAAEVEEWESHARQTNPLPKLRGRPEAIEIGRTYRMCFGKAVEKLAAELPAVAPMTLLPALAIRQAKWWIANGAGSIDHIALFASLVQDKATKQLSSAVEETCLK